MSDVRDQIVETYAQWTALSALRSGAPIKSRRDVYSAIRRAEFGILFRDDLRAVADGEFDEWHLGATARLLAADHRLTVGWAAKILNVYLKTRCYVAGQGRAGLAESIHPPIDSGLWVGLQRQFEGRPAILAKTNCVRRIKDIDSYKCYQRIIDGCREAASALGCTLIELEQLWAGTEFEKRSELTANGPEA
jgi:hypothetical protein